MRDDPVSETPDLDCIQWPPHKCSLHIDHNQHLAYYETVTQALGDPRSTVPPTYDRNYFPDQAEVTKSIETGEVWTIQWYPNTPGSSYRVHAATLSRALAHALAKAV